MLLKALLAIFLENKAFCPIGVGEMVKKREFYLPLIINILVVEKFGKVLKINSKFIIC